MVCCVFCCAYAVGVGRFAEGIWDKVRREVPQGQALRTSSTSVRASVAEPVMLATGSALMRRMS